MVQTAGAGAVQAPEIPQQAHSFVCVRDHSAGHRALGVVSYRQSIDALEQQMAAATGNNLRQVAYSSTGWIKTTRFIRFTAFCPYVMEELSDSDIQWYKLSQRLNNYFEPLSWYNMSINRDFRK